MSCNQNVLKDSYLLGVLCACLLHYSLHFCDILNGKWVQGCTNLVGLDSCKYVYVYLDLLRPSNLIPVHVEHLARELHLECTLLQVYAKFGVVQASSSCTNTHE